MALVGDELYVADTDALLRFPYTTGADADHRARRARSSTLPAGAINHHWTKSLIASPRRPRLYVSVGSNSNDGENGHGGRGGPRGDLGDRSRAPAAHRVFATGLRNPVGLAWRAATAARSGPSVNERDELGGDLVPDYLTSVRDGAFYGWPYSYYGAAPRSAA